MSKSLVVKTQFTAVDGLTKVVRGMTAGVQRFGQSSVAVLHKVDRATHKMGNAFKKATGVVGQFGLALGASAIAMTILNANLELDKSLASLSAITGVTGKEFEAFTKEIDRVSKAQKIFGAETAKAFELVGSAKPELLSSASALAEVATNAITLSKASGDELAGNVAALTNVLNQFELGANESARAMNVLAAASVVGDTKISQTSEAFKVAGSEAKMSGLSIEDLSGAIATFSKYGFKGAEAGTKFRNILSKMSLGEALPKEALMRLKSAGVNIKLVSDKTVPFMTRLKELSKIHGNSAALAKVFGEENKGVASILLSNLPLLEQNIKGVTGTSAASDQAAIKTASLASKWDEVVASFKNSITTTNANNKGMLILKNTLAFLADNMDTIILAVSGLIGGFLAFKAVMIVVNAVMYASPVTWIVVGILALIAAIAALIYYWEDIVKWVRTSDNAFAKIMRVALIPILLLFKVIGKVVNWLSKKWEELVNWVVTSDGSFAKFIRGSLFFIKKLFEDLGKVVNWLSLKWKELINWVSTSDSGFAKFIRASLQPIISGFEYLGLLIDDLFGTSNKLTLEQRGINPATLTNAELGISANVPEAEANKIRTQQIEKMTTNNAKVNIDINDKSGRANVTENTGANINLSKTMSWE